MKRRHGFTLVEVMLAVAILATCAIGLFSVVAAQRRWVADGHARMQAAHLGDALVAELERIRDEHVGADLNPLAVLAAEIPTSPAATPLRFVATHDGLRVRDEREVDGPDGILPGERFFLIELRRISGNDDTEPGAACLRFSALVSWPYVISATANGVVVSERTAASRVLLPVALSL